MPTKKDLEDKAAQLESSGLPIEDDTPAWRMKMMSTQRFKNIVELADAIGDLNADGILFLHQLGDPIRAARFRNLVDAPETYADLRQEARDLLRNADAKTLKWLERASPEDITQLQYSVKFMNGTSIVGGALWKIAFAFGGFMAIVITIYKFWKEGK
jgi:hypothetical protein